MTLTKKTPLANAASAIFITLPPHLLLGHIQLAIKKPHPINETILCVLIFN